MNNNDVIEYIRQNSKHTHAELIAEWLLTGCEVKFLDEDLVELFTCENPTWLSERKYILVKPKPAYRVYLTQSGNAGMVERDGFDPTLESNYNWISDWIEYESVPEIKWPNEYIKRIAEIDESAAQWIVDNIKLNEANSASLWSMFTWKQTPQGHDYWDNIYQTLNASKLASS